MLYTHPRDGHDLRGDDRVKTGWGAGAGSNAADPDWEQFDYAKWNDFTNDLYGELVDRYGKDIIGLFLDEGSSAGDSHRVVDYPRLRQTIKKNHPHLVMQQNYYGTIYSNDVGVKEYHHWQQFENRDGGAWPAWDIPVASVFATTWWAAKPATEKNTVVYSAEDMFRYTVLQAGANTLGGGMQWAAGPYIGGGWEPGVKETMDRFARYLRPVASSIKGTVASAAFPTQKGAALKNIGWGVRAVDWGVATDARDGSATFLHVLNPPAGKRLRVGMTANGARFSAATLLPGGQPVTLELDKAGYVLTLPDDAAWNPVHTAIKLTPVTPLRLPPSYLHRFISTILYETMPLSAFPCLPPPRSAAPPPMPTRKRRSRAKPAANPPMACPNSSRSKYGFFVHYVWGGAPDKPFTIAKDGKRRRHSTNSPPPSMPRVSPATWKNGAWNT